MVYNHGGSFGIKYSFPKGYLAGANLSYAKLDKKQITMVMKMASIHRNGQPISRYQIIIFTKASGRVSLTNGKVIITGNRF